MYSTVSRVNVHDAVWYGAVESKTIVQGARQGSLPRTAHHDRSLFNTASSSAQILNARSPHKINILAHCMSIECRVALDRNLAAEPPFNRTGRESAFTACAEASGRGTISWHSSQVEEA